MISEVLFAFYFAWYFICAFLIFLLVKKTSHQTIRNRFLPIDGLRGILASAVVFHHFFLWMQFQKSNNWSLSSSNFINHLGQSSVAVFFMITAFLFTSKVLLTEKNKIVWRSFFIQRFFRLFPLYIFSVFIGIFITLLAFGTPSFSLGSFFLNDLPHWLSFTLFYTPDTANAGLSGLAHASVYWSLHYEWLFYFSLPILFIAFQKKFIHRLVFLVSSVFILAFVYFHGLILYYLVCFFVGMAAALVVRKTSVCPKYKSSLFSVLIFMAFVALFFLPSGSLLSLIPLSIIFVLISLGCTLWGFLKHPFLLFLGDLSYGIYLLHLPVLFVVFHSLKTDFYSFYSFGLLLAFPSMIFLSYFCHRLIEKNGIQWGRSLTQIKS